MAGFIVIDRIENGIVTCEGQDHAVFTLPLDQLPSGSKVGDCLRAKNEKLVLDAAETRLRREKNLLLLHSLMKSKKKCCKRD